MKVIEHTKKYVFMFCIFIFFFSCSKTNLLISNDGIEITISSSDTLRSDSLYVKIEITNNYNHAICLYGWRNSLEQGIGTFLHFKIYSGLDTLNYCYKGFSVKKPYKDDYITINPECNFSEEIDLSKYYCSEIINNIINGQFNISCIYNYKYKN